MYLEHGEATLVTRLHPEYDSNRKTLGAIRCKTHFELLNPFDHM